MSTENIILDLDISKTVKDLEKSINCKYIPDTIYKLIELIKTFGKNIGTIINYNGELLQYKLPIKYLKNIIPIIFEFDYSYQFINIIYYNDTQTKIYLKLFLSINDEPTIKYIENDHTGIVPSFISEKITLKPGEYLINFSHALFSYLGFIRVRLDDDSYLITKDSMGNELRTKLWLYFLLARGKSWYAKFGYEPGNVVINEYNMLISDIKSIKLNEISHSLKKILFIDDKKNINNFVTNFAEKIIKMIGTSDETLYEYTINHTLEEFTNLTNNLTQSVFAKKIILMDDGKGNPEYITIEFPWFDKYRKLLIGNIMQINNNVEKHFYRLPQIGTN